MTTVAPWLLDKTDFALIYDNSGACPILIGRKRDGVARLDPKAPDEIKAAIRTLEA